MGITYIEGFEDDPQRVPDQEVKETQRPDCHPTETSTTTNTTQSPMNTTSVQRNSSIPIEGFDYGGHWCLTCEHSRVSRPELLGYPLPNERVEEKLCQRLSTPITPLDATIRERTSDWIREYTQVRMDTASRVYLGLHRVPCSTCPGWWSEAKTSGKTGNADCTLNITADNGKAEFAAGIEYDKKDAVCRGDTGWKLNKSKDSIEAEAQLCADAINNVLNDVLNTGLIAGSGGYKLITCTCIFSARSVSGNQAERTSSSSSQPRLEHFSSWSKDTGNRGKVATVQARLTTIREFPRVRARSQEKSGQTYKAL